MTHDAVPVERTPRLALNPISYWLRDGKVDRSREVLSVAFSDCQRLGYQAVKADVPVGMTVREYLEWIGSYGLSPSVSLFSSPLDETVDMTAERERARAFAAQQAEMGLDRAMLSSMMIRDRMAEPGTGADYRADRFRLCVDNAGQICEVFRTEGIRAVLHNHVGGVFETGPEVIAVMDAIPATLLGFGPDTGHLVWAGADPAELIRKYADRMGAIHIKDVFADYLSIEARSGLGYQAATATKRLWAEPGDGIIDFGAVLAAMPANYDGDYMMEVDEPTTDDRYLSLKKCHSWAVKTLPIFLPATDEGVSNV
jgi:inosose dehydratase